MTVTAHLVTGAAIAAMSTAWKSSLVSRARGAWPVMHRIGMESADGRSVFYQVGRNDSALLAAPLGGGPPREVVKCVRSGGFFSVSQGIYYVACDPDADAAVHFQDRSTGRDELVGKLEKAATNSPYDGLAMSPDGTKILYSKIVSQGSDVMMIENFK